MNKQIKELIERATIRGEEYLPGNDGHPTPTFYFDKEKFAELIIRDCASLCEIQSRSYTYSFTPAKARLAESTAQHCATIINRHFGVEQ